MKPVAASLLCLFALLFLQTTPEYSIEAIRYGTIPQFRVAGLVMGAPEEERMDIAVVVWPIRGEGRTILFDSGFFRQSRIDRFNVTDYVRPDEAVRLAGVEPGDVTDIIISHAHWDHMGGIGLFPNATIWIQKAEYDYYTGQAWQEGARRGGVEAGDILELVRRNTEGQVRLIGGDDQEIIPGIRVYTGARHTYSSQYIRVTGTPTFVLASDNCYPYRNIETGAAVSTFATEDREANVAAFRRMERLAGARERVVPGHDPLQFERFPTQGRIARIK